MGIEELKKEREEKFQIFKEKGIDPYNLGFKPRYSIKDILDSFEEKKDVSCAGRLKSIRQHGKVVFADISSDGFKVQIYVNKKDLAEKFDIFKLCDVGDIIGISGMTFKTHTGEMTIQVKDIAVFSKSVRPIPEKWHGLKDIEERYRKRYLDLISNENVKNFFKVRSRIISTIREFLDSKGYMEVDTPMLHKIPGGAAGDPFKTHLNVYNMDLYLRIAPELYLKRLLVGGYEKVYELNRSFRNEGVSTRHNPEFTMLEIYEAYADYNDMMRLAEELIVFVCKKINGTDKIEFNQNKIDLSTPWKKLSFVESLGLNPETADSDKAMELIRKKINVPEGKISRSQILNISEEMVESKVTDSPTFVVDYLKQMCPLAKAKKNNAQLCERFELFISGMEVANAYSELNDPCEQRKRFEDQLKQSNKDLSELDKDYVEALEYGMPPAGGLGIGIDRLVMLLTNNSSIRDVILFPQLKTAK